MPTEWPHCVVQAAMSVRHAELAGHDVMSWQKGALPKGPRPNDRVELAHICLAPSAHASQQPRDARHFMPHNSTARSLHARHARGDAPAHSASRPLVPFTTAVSHTAAPHAGIR
jgi:hypothetical protein